MGRLLGLLARFLIAAVVGIGTFVRPRLLETPEDEPGRVALTPEERALASRLPSPREAAEAHERATHSPLPPDWSRPKPEKTPKPTYWPFALAVGLTFVAWGVISNLFVFFGGLLLFLVAIVAWIGDLLNEFA